MCQMAFCVCGTLLVNAGGWSASQESPANEDALVHAVQTYLQTSSWVLSAQLDWSKKVGHFSFFPNKVFRQ